MSLLLPSFAKVNLYLRVLRKRSDGFHDIFTVFQTVSLHDTLTFERIDEGLILECADTSVPVDDSNLIIRGANLIRERFGVSAGARIILEKRIPMGGGLGGGSSNAAVALMGLSRLWGLELPVEAFLPLAERLGSDVPFFFQGGTMIGIGRGTEFEPSAEFEESCMLIVTPDVHVSTSFAYHSLNAQNLTNEEANRILRVCRSEAESPDFLHSAIRNDFEGAVFAEFPEIRRVKDTLIGLEASQVLMSGSGASVFAIFDKEETRQTAIKALDSEVNWRKFAVAALSRDEYREKLGL